MDKSCFNTWMHRGNKSDRIVHMHTGQVHHNIPSSWPRHSDLPLRQRRGAEVEGLRAGVPRVFYRGAHTGPAVCWRVKWAQAEHTEQRLMQPDPIGGPSIFGTPACFAADKLHIWPGCEEQRRSVSFLSGGAVSWWMCRRVLLGVNMFMKKSKQKKKNVWPLCIRFLPAWLNSSVPIQNKCNLTRDATNYYFSSWLIPDYFFVLVD